MSCRCVTSAVSLTISGIKPGFALLLERVASALTQGLPSGSLIMADRSFSLPLAFHGVIVRVRTGSSPSPVGGEQLRPQCCHCGRYSLYGFRGRCRRRPFLGLNHCWPLPIQLLSLPHITMRHRQTFHYLHCRLRRR